MNINRIDTCGTSCPQPVLMTKKALKDNTKEIEILVDNNTSKSNVEKFLNSKGFNTTIENNTEETFIVKAKK
jgi:tRNA 2-thiouridine synthesizing protein A